MKKFLENRSILFVFIAVFAAVTIISVGGIFVLFQVRLSTLITEDKFNENKVISMNFSEFIENSFESELNIIKGVVNNLEVVDSLTFTEKTSYYQNVLDDSNYLISIDILDSNMIVEETYPYTELREGYELKYFIQQTGYLPHEEFTWIRPYTTPRYDEIVLSLVYKSDGHFIFATYSLDLFDDIYDGLVEVAPNKNMIILDKHGIFTYDSTGNRELQRVRYEDFDTVKYFYENNVVETIDIDGEESVVSLSYIASQDWYLAIYESRVSALGIFIEITFIVLTVILGIIFIYLFAIIHSMSIVKASVIKVYQSMKKVTSGDYGHKLSDIRFKEFQSIKKEFNDMSASLELSTERLKNLAYYDQLTALHSRIYLYEKYAQIEKDKSYYCLYIDINRFTIINDVYGYDFGSQVIINFASRLTNIPIDGIEVYKSEGDEFILMIDESVMKHNEKQTLEYIESTLTKPYIIKEIEVHLHVSIGVSKYPSHSENIDDVVRGAIIAMTEVKKNQFVNYGFFEPLHQKLYSRRIEIELSVDDGFLNDEFYLVFHPIINTDDQALRGFEALSRWEHHKLGLIGPVEYIPILERTKKIHLLDMFVLDKSLEHMSEIKSKYNQDYVISVNLSVDTILHPDFIDLVKEKIKKYHYNPRYLELEVTESTIIKDFEQIKKVMNDLRKLGVRFSEDDFGDGFSALNYLTRLDLSTLKISKNLTDTIDKDKKTRLLIKYIIELAKELEFETIIEGVETKEVYDICKEIECTYIQGYYFYRPMTFNQILELIEKKS